MSTVIYVPGMVPAGTRIQKATRTVKYRNQQVWNWFVTLTNRTTNIRVHAGVSVSNGGLLREVRNENAKD